MSAELVVSFGVGLGVGLEVRYSMHALGSVRGDYCIEYIHLL